MRRRLALVLAALLSAAPAGAETGAAKLSDMADELQRIQTRIASGDKAAYAAQLAELKAMGAAIAAAKPETWQDKREADSLVIYVLSGGSLADVAPLIKSDAPIESERTLARGAVAYITSHEADALRPWPAPILPRSTFGSPDRSPSCAPCLKPSAIRKRRFRCSTGRVSSPRAGWSRRRH